MKDSIFEYVDYKQFVNDLIRSKGSQGRGMKRALAISLTCQSPFISQVLAGALDFNADQGLACAQFFGLSKEETEYFLLLVAKAKASTLELKKYLQQSIEAKRQSYRLVQKRMKMKEAVEQERQATYYSSWMYAAVHMALTIPELRTRESLSNKLGLSIETVDKVLEFLRESTLVEKKGTSFQPTGYWYHLDKTSPLLNKHHTNVQLKSLQSLDCPQEHDLHYSAFFSCSRKDLARLEELLLKTLSEFNALVRPSAEEELAAINLNIFRV